MKTVFWPKNESIPAVKCSHRHGADMTFSMGTDTRVSTSIYAAEWYAFKHNIRIGAFISEILTGYDLDIKVTEDTGIYRHDTYYATDYWKNPVSGVIEIIPDYYATTWSSAGAAYFAVTPGAAKVTRYPSHGQQMYDLSGGALGMDYPSGTVGASGLSEVFGIDDFEKNWFHSILGRYPSAGSYRNGDGRGWKTHLTRWLSFRNSSPNPTDIDTAAATQYGSGLGNPPAATDRDLFINYPSSARLWDSVYGSGLSEAAVMAFFREGLAQTLANGGWYRVFIHFHSMRDNGTLSFFDTVYTNLAAETAGAFVWKCSNGEALEYMFARDSVKRVAAVTRGAAVLVIVEFENYLNAPLELVNTPLSVEVDLTGTTLAGKTLKASFGKLISLGANKYIVSVPYKGQFSSVQLSEGADGVYNTARPVISYSVTSGVLTVNTNMPTKAVLYSKAEGSPEADFMPAIRSNYLAETRAFPISAGVVYGVGAVSEFGLAASMVVIS